LPIFWHQPYELQQKASQNNKSIYMVATIATKNIFPFLCKESHLKRYQQAKAFFYDSQACSHCVSAK